MTKFKAGDRVKLTDNYPVASEPYRGFPSRFGTVKLTGYGESYGVAWDALNTGWRFNEKGAACGWWVDGEYLTPAMRTPSVADDLRLKPQAQTVLLHLKNHGHITPAKADVVYGYRRLAAQIFEIRSVGYKVTKTMKRDDQGHPYAYYELVA